MSAFDQPAISSGSAIWPPPCARQQVEVLEDHADGTLRQPQLATGQRRDIAALDLDATGGRLFEAVDEADEARLAGARAADDAGDRAARNREIDVLQRPHARLAAIGRIRLLHSLEPHHRVCLGRNTVGR